MNSISILQSMVRLYSLHPISRRQTPPIIVIFYTYSWHFCVVISERCESTLLISFCFASLYVIRVFLMSLLVQQDTTAYYKIFFFIYLYNSCGVCRSVGVEWDDVLFQSQLPFVYSWPRDVSLVRRPEHWKKLIANSNRLAMWFLSFQKAYASCLFHKSV